MLCEVRTHQVLQMVEGMEDPQLMSSELQFRSRQLNEDGSIGDWSDWLAVPVVPEYGS